MTKKKEDVIEAEEVEDDYGDSNLPVSQDRIDTPTIIANIDAQAEIFTKLQKYVKDNLEPKTDYYSIRKDAKPSLGKSGAEKINFIFNLVPKYVILSEIHNDSEIAYKIRCDLYNKNSGKFMGSGVGSCSSKEDKIQKSMAKQYIKNVQSVDNNILKMAKKRSYVDATLSSTMASFIFTQDLEDGYLGSESSGGYSKGKSTAKGSPKQTADDKFTKAKEFWDSYDWEDKDLKEKPEKTIEWKGRKFSEEQSAIYNYATGLIPKDTVNDYLKEVTKKKNNFEYTYGDFKKAYTALKEIEDENIDEKLDKEFPVQD